LDSIDAALRALGYASFRPGQREAVDTLLSAGRVLLVAPTGGGKSLCYQLPALVLPGTTLVVSPLIALMHDQVAALGARGIAASFLASTLPPEEIRERLARFARGEYRLLYVAPERLTSGAFRDALGRVECPLVAVDEAHCISEWGHDFRPEYMQIGGLLAALPGARVLACTATATPVVRDEILGRLGLPPETPQLVRGFARPNLALRAVEVGGQRDRAATVDAALAEALDRWELSLFQNEPFRSEQLRGALAGLLGETWELRAAVLLGEASEERRAIHAALRALAGGEPASARAEDTVRRSLVETLRHGDRAKLVRSLDETLLGLRSAPRLAETA